MDKKIAIIAVAVVAIVIIAAFSVTMLNNDSDDAIYWSSVSQENQKIETTQGSIDGSISLEPYTSDLILSLDSKVLIESGEVWPDHPGSVLAVNTAFAENHPELVARAVAAHVEATNWIIDTVANKSTDQGNYTKLVEMAMASINANETVVMSSFENITLLCAMNEQFKDYLEQYASDFRTIRQITDSMISARGYDSVSDFVDTIVDDSYLSQAAELNKTASILGDVNIGYQKGDINQMARIVASNESLWNGTPYEGKNLFEQWGVNVSTTTAYANGVYVMQGFETGAVDLGYLDPASAIVRHLRVNTNNSDIRVVAQVNTEGLSLIVDEDIGSVDDLRGKTIGITNTASMNYLLLLSLAKENDLSLKPAAVIYWVQVPPVNQKDQIAQGLIDGGVSWEPYCSDSILSGSANALLWSGEFWPNHPCCIVAVNTDFGKDNPELVARVLAAHIEATEWILYTIENKETEADNYTKLLQMGASFSGRNTTVVAESLEHMTLLYDINDELKEYLVSFTEDFITLQQTSAAALDARGYSSVENFVDTFVNDSYIEAAASLSKVDSTIGTVRLGYLQGDLHQFARVVASDVDLWDGTEYEGKNLFTQWGVQITSPSPYANGALVMQGFDTGVIDMGYLGSPPAIVKHLNVNTPNSNIRIVAQANVEGSAIIVNPEILSIEDLAGKTIGTPGPGSIQHLMLLAFAQEYGFRVKLSGT